MTDDLIKGVQDFKYYHYLQDNDLMTTLAEEGQNPKYFIISCIDSRCNPGTIFRARPGIFFSHKAMGAIVRPYKSGTALAAALQFAITYQNIETVIVLGHTKCGAVKALVEDLDDAEIRGFIDVARHGHEKSKRDYQTNDDILAATEKEVVLESLKNLETYPPIKSALKNKKLTMKAWQFDIMSGDLFEYNIKTKNFMILNGEPATNDRRTKK